MAVLLGVLAATGYFAFVAFAAPALPAPSISAGPANPTNVQSASFTYTDSAAITRFECQRDGLGFAACGTTRPSTMAYAGPLAEGSHTFQVRAVSGTTTSALTSYSWTIDITRPVVTINSGPTGLTASTSASFGFSGSEAGSFQCSLDSTASPVACTSPKSYSGLAQGTHTFFVRETDLAGNTSAVWAQRSWTVDTLAPPAPVITTRPDDPNGDGISIFEWTESEAGVVFQCSKENGAFQSCTSGISYIVDVSNAGTHQFAVRALDAAGNISTAAFWSWKVDQSVRFTIIGNASGLLYPGVLVPLALKIVNQNNFAITITDLGVVVSTSPSGCPASPNNIYVQPSPVSPTNTFTVPANNQPDGTLVPAAFQPQIRLNNTAQNQDTCKNKTFSLSYTGTATK